MEGLVRRANVARVQRKKLRKIHNSGCQENNQSEGGGVRRVAQTFRCQGAGTVGESSKVRKGSWGGGFSQWLECVGIPEETRMRKVPSKDDELLSGSEFGGGTGRGERGI